MPKCTLAAYFKKVSNIKQVFSAHELLRLPKLVESSEESRVT